MPDNTSEWSLYQKGKDYNARLDLVANVDKCERVYSGDQWAGVVSNGLPTPCFNIHKRTINHFISSIMSQAVKGQFSPENVPEESQDPNDLYAKKAAEIVNDQCEILWERLKMDSQMRHALRDAALSGDMAGWPFWNEKLTTAQDVEGITPQGDIDFELVDNVNVFFGNPNDYRVQTQPYILVAFRALVTDLREEAKANGASENDIANITADQDYQDQSGDRAKIELNGKDDDGGKTTALVKLWKDKKTGKIMWTKSTRNVVIRKEQDYDLTLYPIAWASWDYRKNSYHGQPIGLELIPNQIFINKMFAMVMLHLMNVAFPKAVYNANLITAWSNQIGQAIPYNGDMEINKIAGYLQPGNMSNQVMQVIDAAIAYTKDMIGASDAALGDVKPDNTSAIIAVQQAAAIPLETVKANLYQWVEDIYNIWYDFMASKYGVRKVLYQGQPELFDFSILRSLKMKLKVDVGPSTYWSEITAAQTLDNLLRDEKIDFIQYLERMPDGFIPQKQELIDDLKKAAAQEQPPQPPPPSTNIAFKDLPMAGQIQLAAQHGIQLTPQDFELMQIAGAIVQQQQQAQAEQQAIMEQEAMQQQGQPPMMMGGI